MKVFGTCRLCGERVKLVPFGDTHFWIVDEHGPDPDFCLGTYSIPIGEFEIAGESKPPLQDETGGTKEVRR